METSSATSLACPGGTVNWARAELAGQQGRPRVSRRRRFGLGDECGVIVSTERRARLGPDTPSRCPWRLLRACSDLLGPGSDRPVQASPVRPFRRCWPTKGAVRLTGHAGSVRTYPRRGSQRSPSGGWCARPRHRRAPPRRRTKRGAVQICPSHEFLPRARGDGGRGRALIVIHSQSVASVDGPVAVSWGANPREALGAAASPPSAGRPHPSWGSGAPVLPQPRPGWPGGAPPPGGVRKSGQFILDDIPTA